MQSQTSVKSQKHDDHHHQDAAKKSHNNFQQLQEVKEVQEKEIDDNQRHQGQNKPLGSQPIHEIQQSNDVHFQKNQKDNNNYAKHDQNQVKNVPEEEQPIHQKPITQNHNVDNFNNQNIVQNQQNEGKFGCSLKQLMDIAQACQERNFSEDVDLFEQLGGPEKLESMLQTDFKRGIRGDEQDLQSRDQAYGNNEKPPVELSGFCELFLGALDDFTVKILIVAATVAIILETSTADDDKRQIAWIDGFAIFCAVFVVGTVTAINDYQKERQFAKLNQVSDQSKVVTVFRNGEMQNIHMSKVMVGDLVKLTEGMEIPADGIVLEASDLQTDESAMTGETDPIKKNKLSECIKIRNKLINSGEKNSAKRHDVPSVIIMSGTRILNGEGSMVITVVGDNSCSGKISALLRQTELESTPLQQKLEALARDIGKFGLISASLILFVLLLRFTIERSQEGFETHHFSEILEYFILAVTVVAVAIPEGLPLSVTLSLAFSVKKMLKDQNLVKKLQACETMGGADCICSDKTGTLTKNEMTLTNWWNGELHDFERQNKFDLIQNQEMSPQFADLFKQMTAINSSAYLRPEVKGSKTEVAILKLLDLSGNEYEKIRQQYEVIEKFPFSSKRKRMSTIILVNQGNQYIKRIHVKGASEMVLGCCTHWRSKVNDQIQQIDSQTKEKMLASIKQMADNALRTIVLAYKDLPDNADLTSKNQNDVYDIETKDLILCAIFGIYDIVRPEVPHAIEQCIKAGIKVRMVTGDNRDTARAIAKECGIIPKDHQALPDSVLEGPIFNERIGGVVCKKHREEICECARDKKTAQKKGVDIRVDTIKNAEEFNRIYKQLDVLARSRPEDKYALVTGLIERGHVVAVTGDGTNDAPALKKADVGFAMGIAGTEVAKEAADIILIDDNFKSILAAVLWGRNIYECIKKFIQFQLTVNIVAVVITFIGAAVIKQEVLSPVQMLWVNLIMDTLASLALATEPPNHQLLEQPPHDRDEYIIKRKMFKHILCQASYQLLIMLVLLFAGDGFLPEFYDDFDIEFLNDKLNPYFNEGKLWKVKYSTAEKKYVTPGFLRSVDGKSDKYELVYNRYDVPSRHFTIIFNTFVMMQVFNFLNARKINDELNIFKNINNNPLFIGVVFIVFAFQILLIFVGGIAFKCYKYGLTVEQWFICIAFGIGGNFWSIIIKQLPDNFFPQIGDKKADPIADKSKVLSLKGQRNESGLQRRFSSIQNTGNRRASQMVQQIDHFQHQHQYQHSHENTQK